MSRRLLLTLATACTLTGLSAVYAALVRPLVNLPASARFAPVAALDGDAPRPVENVRIAEAYLAHQPWAASAGYHLRSQQAFVYTNDWQPEGNEGRVRLQPFAMAWVDVDRRTGEEQVTTVVSESALVKFAGSYEMANPDPGRVVSAALQGRSQVAGPNGLQIDGHNFYFSESSALIYSDHPVWFAYAGNTGSAQKMQIDLMPQKGVPERDRPHIFGIRTLRLSQSVIMELQLKQKQEPLQLTIKSDSFDYEVTPRRAIYSTDVRAYRKTGPNEYDLIDCDRMTVDFAPAATASTSSETLAGRAGYQQLDKQLQFRRMQANCVPAADKKRRTVVLTSMAHKLRAEADSLVYDGEQRTVTLNDPQGVIVKQERNKLQAPEITLQLGEAGRLAGALCRGAGWLVHRDANSSEVLFAADWRQELRYQPDPESGLDLWQLGDSATFRQPGRSTALGADHIRIWTTPPKSTPLESQPASPLSQGIEPRRMAAVGNVVLISPRVEADCQQLEASIDPAPPPASSETPGAVRTASAEQSSTELASEKQDQPYRATAEHIRVRLLSRDDRRQPDLAEIWTDGRVSLRQPQPDGQPPRTITGGHVHLQNHGGNDQTVHIVGKPAQLRDQGFYLDALDMHVHRAENRVTVDGPGALQLPLKSDLDGKPLREPLPLDVTWKERMSFDGTLATFTGNAVARMGDRQMTCRQMQVTLSDRVSFSERDRNATAVQVAAVNCRDDVTFRNLTYDQNTVIGIQLARVWELDIDRVTGKLHAQGPGEMQMWRRGQTPRAGLAAPQTAKANRPVEIDPAEWEYTRVEFDGQMAGNIEQGYSEFYDRVEIVHGPVRQSTDKIHRDAIPKGGGWMRCGVLRVMQQPATDRKRDYIQLVGEGDADLEGRGFHAKADQIVYDESKGTYLLRGFGKRYAMLWRETAPGAWGNPNIMQRMVVNPVTVELIGDGVVEAGQ